MMYRGSNLQSSVGAILKHGDWGDGCLYRFRILPGEEIPTGGKESFAGAVAAFCTADLGGAGVPALRFYKAAERGERADFGSDNWNGNGYAEPSNNAIFIRQDLHPAALVDVVAHETLHALKHRNRTHSIEDEREAVDYGLHVSDIWGVSPSWSNSELFVVDSWRDLPGKAFPDSRAFCRDDLSLYMATGTTRFPRWKRYRRPKPQP